MKADGTTDFGRLFSMKDSVVIVGGINDPTPKGVFLFEDNKLKIRDYAAHQKFAGIYEKAEKQTSSSRNNNRRRPKRGSVKSNPADRDFPARSQEDSCRKCSRKRLPPRNLKTLPMWLLGFQTRPAVEW